MTAAEIADRLGTDDITAARIKKLEALCARMKVELDAVIALLPPDVQAHIQELRS